MRTWVRATVCSALLSCLSPCRDSRWWVLSALEISIGAAPQ
jgi:hypothetical protein